MVSAPPADSVEYAQLLNDGSEIVQTHLQAHELCGQKTGAGKILKLPTQKPDVVVPVIELFLK